MQKRLLSLLLPFFLLLAQQGGMWHELSHLRSPERSTRSEQPRGQSGEKQAPVDRLCDVCLAFSAIAGAAKADWPTLQLLSFTHARIAAVAWRTAEVDAPTARSRSPPSFL